MKIGFVCNEYPPGPHGGIGTYTQMAARGLVEAGHQVRVVGTYRHDYPAPDVENVAGVHVTRLRTPRRRFGWVWARHKVYQAVRQLCLSGDIDIVEIPDNQGWGACWPRLPAPVVVKLHGSTSYFAAEAGEQPKGLSFWLERAALRRADRWCSVSHYTAQQTKTLFALQSGPHAILHNPVRMPGEQVEGHRSSDDVVFTGTLVAKKGVVPLIESWREVVHSCPSARLHVYGKDGVAPNGESMQSYLCSLLDESQRDTVHFYDHVTRETLQTALSSARLAVFPSYAEAFAIAPMEAMVCGCPTIYSRRGSGPELIRDGRDGLLIDPDDHAGLSAAIVQVLSDDDLAGRLGTGGRRRILDCFTIEHAIAEYEAFYRNTISAFALKHQRIPTPSQEIHAHAKL